MELLATGTNLFVYQQSLPVCMVVYQFQSCLSHVQILVVYQYHKIMNKENNTIKKKNIKLQAISPWLFTSCGVAYHMGRTWLFTSKNKQHNSVVVCATIHVVYQ